MNFADNRNDPARLNPLLGNGGACAALLSALDWSDHPLGDPAQWPQALRTVIDIAFGSTRPVIIIWGPDRTLLYNDGFAAICGARHPKAFARPARELWASSWDRIGPILDAAFDGLGSSMDNLELVTNRNGYPEHAHFAFSCSPVHGPDGSVAGAFCTCTEITSQIIMQRRIERDRQQMLRVFEIALGAVAMLRGPDHVFTFANHDYQLLVGHRNLVGRPVAEALPEVVAQGFINLLDTVFETGEPFVGRNIAVKLQRSASSQPEDKVIDFLYHPTLGDDGNVDGIFVQAMDVTERADAERQQQLLHQELSHRMKNQLALVQAISNQTLRAAPDLASGRKSLNERIGMLARAHDLLISGTTIHVTLDAIVREVIALHDDGSGTRFMVDGPTVEVGSRAALSLSLLLHELSTNSMKYGALSAEGGRVSIIWRIEKCSGGSRLAVDWSESGGPAVSEPTKLGSGSRLLKAGVAGAAASAVKVDYRPEGVCCEILADLESLQS